MAARESRPTVASSAASQSFHPCRSERIGMAIPVPQGYRMAGAHCGLKRNPTREDLSLVVSDAPAVAAGVYTQNLVFAAPVALDRARTPGERLSRGGDEFRQCQCLHGRARLGRCPRNGPAWPRPCAMPTASKRWCSRRGSSASFCRWRRSRRGFRSSAGEIGRRRSRPDGRGARHDDDRHGS